MTYSPTLFDRLPADQVLARRGPPDPAEPYCFDDTIAIAVDVALATRRPLLVSGEPGCGKSRLAHAVAAVQGWNLITETITSRTRIETLTAEVDQLRRLNDAQAAGWRDAAMPRRWYRGAGQPRGTPARARRATLKPDPCYLNPGCLWWAFAPDSARRRGLGEDLARAYAAELDYPGTCRGADRPTVLLIDEIDKAEPDLPNDLLEPLDRRRFKLPGGVRIAGSDSIEAPPEPEPDADGTPRPPHLLTIITTNGERELPPAFIRRCVRLRIADPTPARLTEIGHHHYPPARPDDDEQDQRIQAIAARIAAFADQARQERRRPPGTAEFLDAVLACKTLGIRVGDDRWAQVELAVLDKGDAPRGASGGTARS